MHTFKDTEGRDWTLALNFASRKRLVALLPDADPFLLVQEGNALFERLTRALSCDDWAFVVDVAFALAKPDADRLGVTDEGFAAALGGDAMHALRTALVAEYLDFFPEPEVRKRLRAVVEKTEAFRTAALGITDERIAAVDPESAARLILSNSSGSAPGPSASTPAP